MSFIFEHSSSFISALRLTLSLLIAGSQIGDAIAAPSSGTTVQLSGKVEFVEIDHLRNVIYVSVPEQNQVLVLNMNDLSVVSEIDFVGQPQGLDISDDNSTLYIALSGTGSIGVVDLTDQYSIVEEISVADQITPTDSAQINAVFLVESIGDRVFAAADGRSSSHLVAIDTTDNNRVLRVGIDSNGDAIEILANPNFYINQAGTELIADPIGGSVRVDLTDTDYPVVFKAFTQITTDVALELSATKFLSIRGEEFDALSFELLQRYGNSISRFVSSKNQKFAIDVNGDVDSYSVGYPTQPLIELSASSIRSVCNVGPGVGVSQTILDSQDSGIFRFFENGVACYFSQDTDQDNVFDAVDNCQAIANSDQLNTDSDNLGNACDDDDDGDGILDVADLFPLSPDGDNDGVLDPDDAYPAFFGAALDSDGDGMPDAFFDTCDELCISESGLVEDLDDDDDLLIDNVDDQPLIPSQAAIPFVLSSTTFSDLPGEPRDIVVDADRSFAYVSIADTNEIHWVSLKNFQSVFSYQVDGVPGVLALSDDASKLIVALNDSGTLQMIDLLSPSLESETVDLSLFLGDSINRRANVINDVAIVGNRMFVVSEGPSPLLEVDLESFELVARSDFSIAGSPLLQADQQAEVLYVETEARISSYDIKTQVPALIDTKLVSGNAIKKGFTLSNNKDFLFLGEGIVVPTDFSENELLSFTATIEYQTFESDSVTAASPNPIEQSIVDTRANVLFSFDTDKFVKTGQIAAPCGGLSPNYVPIFKHAQDDKGWLLTLENEGQYRICFEPRPDDYAGNFSQLPQSTDISDFFSLENTTPRYYSEPQIDYFSRVFLSERRVIDGIENYQLIDSRGESQFLVQNENGIFLTEAVDPENRLIFSDSIPLLPEHMRQGARSFTSGELTLSENGLPDRIRTYRASIIVDNYRQITLADNESVDAYRVNRTVTVAPGTAIEANVSEQFWFAEGIGFVRQDENEIIDFVAFLSPDTDGDTFVDFLDNDDDGDSVPDLQDAFPLDSTETTDFDRDGVGDNRDRDDDNDGISDVIELSNGLNPRDPTDGGQDFDGDGRDNATEFRQGTNPFVADEAPDTPFIVAPILRLLLDD